MDEIRVQKPTILVVNDSPDDISSNADLLNGEYEIRTATGAEKALTCLKNHSEIDLILLDIVMPDMDGFELCKKIKQIPESSSAVVIFLTALEKESDIVKLFESKVPKARVKTHIDLKRFHDNVLDSLKKERGPALAADEAGDLGRDV
ncbi:MAG: response regulator [Campylobacterales bacterium]|nr:response regulator [Campylobacterales bacterium]